MKIFVLCITSFLFIGSLSAQHLTITEIDETGNTRNLTQSRQAIDINSTLQINLNLDFIRSAVDQQMISGGSQAVDELIATLNIYKDYIEQMDATILQYEMEFAGSEKNVNLAALTTALKQRGAAGEVIVDMFPDDSRFAKRREELLPTVAGQGSSARYQLIMQLLAEEVMYVEDDLMRLRKEAGFSYQLAAWSITSRGQESLHLDGFDELPPGEYYHYERNRLYLTQDQIDELASLTAFFEDEEGKNILARIVNVIPGILANSLDIQSINGNLEKVKKSLQDVVTQVTVEKEKVLAEVSRLEENWKALKTDIETLREKYLMRNGTSGEETKMELLRNFMDDIGSISTRVKTLSENVKSIQSSVDLAALGAGLDDINTNLKNLQDELITYANSLVTHSKEAFQLAVYGRKINSAALVLSDKVLKLSIDQIPSSTTLDLLYTGKREPGDLIVIKSMIRKGDEKHPFATEKRDFPIMNALPHVEMSIVYAFAKPVIKESNFKGGPLVSILYKFKSWSLPYRNFLDPGIGLHAASFDFNNDDTPEFAGGMVLSIFKDYLQGGWGFNFNANRGYWFAGLRIPIPTSPVTIVGN